MIKDHKTVELYAAYHARLHEAIDMLREFAATMPAPNDDFELPTVSYGYVGSVGEIVRMASEAAFMAEEIR
jgi:hypothetical protein